MPPCKAFICVSAKGLPSYFASSPYPSHPLSGGIPKRPTKNKRSRSTGGVHAPLTMGILRLHTSKRFIGTAKRGFDFLGYQIKAGPLLRPSAESMRRLEERSRRLYEREGSPDSLWRYLTRWTAWLWGGLRGMVSKKGGRKRYYYYIVKRLRIDGVGPPPPSP